VPDKALKAEGTVRLDPAAAGQTIAGFGASGCWWAKDVGGWASEKTDKIIEWLFD
jgi:O-glycosyl hydrolase